MARDGVAVRAEVASAVSSHCRGVEFNVAAVCRDLGISTKTFYKYAARFKQCGIAGFFPDSRRPLTSPTRLPTECEEVLVRVRKEEAGAGWDYGADAVLLRLREHPQLWPFDRPLPARATINRVFESRGQLEKVPKRRPRRTRRFERENVNELWQYDGFCYLMAPEAEVEEVCVLHLSDDCSRTDLALQAARSENGADVWETFCLAVQRYGLPAAVLKDNGTAFSGRRGVWESQFETRLGDLGVRSVTSSIAHPQTCGKNERAHQRVRKWLDRRPPARSLIELQMLLDEYREGFNGRGNRVLEGLTPHQRFDLGPLAGPNGPLAPATQITRHTVSDRGTIGLQGLVIGIGRRHARQRATSFRSGDQVVIFLGDDHVRDLTLDRSRRYQPMDP